jgi:nucleoside-diphosphate-sugar epimerase
MRWLGRAGSWLRDRSLPSPLTEGMIVAVCSHLYYSSEKAVRELGWSYRPYAEAIRDQVAWMRERGLV